jgi:hypothetical protein
MEGNVGVWASRNGGSQPCDNGEAGGRGQPPPGAFPKAFVTPFVTPFMTLFMTALWSRHAGFSRGFCGA